MALYMMYSMNMMTEAGYAYGYRGGYNHPKS
jgi:hypothetical protein